MKLIDADALERDGWQMSRTVQIDKNTMEFQTRKPTDFPAIEQRMRGKWNEHPKYTGIAYLCSQCNWFTTMLTHFCPNCGADMRGTE